MIHHLNDDNSCRLPTKWGINSEINWCVATSVSTYFSGSRGAQSKNSPKFECFIVHCGNQNRSSMLGYENLSIWLTRGSWRSKPLERKVISWVVTSYRLGLHRDSYPNTSFVLLGLPHSLAFSIKVEKLRWRSINFFSSVRISEKSTSSPRIEHCEVPSQTVSHLLLFLRETIWFDRSSR